MTFPAFILTLVIALLYGALYHFLRNGNGWRLLLYCGLSLLGFLAGHWLGTSQGWTFFMLGSLNLGFGTLGSLIFLIAGEWLSRTETRKKSSV